MVPQSRGPQSQKLLLQKVLLHIQAQMRTCT
jgi:hypothetical protein